MADKRDCARHSGACDASRQGWSGARAAPVSAETAISAAPAPAAILEILVLCVIQFLLELQ
ncbi:hypothetical protein ASF51_17925 [Agreia sp. Leaf283]|nr:hypothetical protein ASF51_17925 [Agreia sp. Leaf283]